MSGRACRPLTALPGPILLTDLPDKSPGNTSFPHGNTAEARAEAASVDRPFAQGGEADKLQILPGKRRKGDDVNNRYQTMNEMNE